MNMQKTITPINNSLYLERPYLENSEIDKTIDTSVRAFKEWRQTTVQERIQVVNKFIDNLINLGEEVKK